MEGQDNVKVVRMRTIDGLHKEIHELDPLSQVSRNFIRQLIITGKVKSVKAGNKHLANLDEVLRYLSNPIEIKEQASPGEFGKLRKIET